VKIRQKTTSSGAQISKGVLAGCIGLAILSAIYPFARAAFRVEIDYNEGWNVYNAARVAHHLQLYPVAYGWQTVNYPMLSFALMAFLHNVTHDYLYTARAVSLLSLVGTCWLVSAIVRQLGGAPTAALLAGFFTLGVFCTDADWYVGMDDPQLLAQCVFLFGLYLYLRSEKGYADATVAALIFVIAGSIKHNQIDFPLAVLIDIALVSWRKSLWFAACGIAFAAISVGLNIHFGGPFFVAEMLAPRLYSLTRVGGSIAIALGPLLIPMLTALVAAAVLLLAPRRRIAGILFCAALAVGAAFGGGIGVSVNTFFTCMVASCVVLGLGLSDLLGGRYSWADKIVAGVPLRSLAAPVFFLSLIVPALVAGIANPIAQLRDTAQAEQRFNRQVAFLQAKSAPVLCESLLRCYFARQPYVYDPFNATRLIDLHKLDPSLLLDGLRNGTYSAVQLDGSPEADEAQSERFSAPVLAAIRQNYQATVTDADTVIYIPNPRR
jgi:hypothetical protein